MNIAPNRIAPVCGKAFESRQVFDVGAFASRHGGVTVSRLKSGSALYTQGDPADSLFYVMTGQVQTSVVSEDGKEGILGVLEPGVFCGEGCLLGNRKRAATAACIADSTVARLERANVIRACREDPSVAEFFLVFALKTVVRLRLNLISQLFDSSEQRLARILLVLANHGKDGQRDNVIRNVDQEALAHMIGTTRSRVNHFMNKFRNLGYIDYDDTIVVNRSLADFVRREAPPVELRPHDGTSGQ